MVALIVAMPANGDKGVWKSRDQTPFSAETRIENPTETVNNEYDIKVTEFPEGFAFGASTSALQIEGSLLVGGRGPSVRDVFLDEHPDSVPHGTNFCRALDSYRRYNEDVQRLVELGVKYYRFSISWTRILPNGTLTGGVRQEGIDHYKSLIDELKKNHIEPVVTLLHFDSPQALEEDYKTYLSPKFVNDFKEYAKLCFKNFGDKVKIWITMNEPYIVAYVGYDLGMAAPGRCSPDLPSGGCPAGNSSTEPYNVTHNMLLAHATVHKLYKEDFYATQAGQVGISHLGEFAEPYDKDSKEDVEAAKRVLDFKLGWFMEPLVFGEYPQSMRDKVKDRLPKITKEEKELLKGAFDFVGINYYSSSYAKEKKPVEPHRYSTDSWTEETLYNRNGTFIGEKAEGSNIYVYPKGLQSLMEFMHEKYNHPKIYITENEGVTEANCENRPLNLVLKDDHRISYMKKHLYHLRQAISKGVDVKGYFFWALFDDFEWTSGYLTRFGLFYVDYKNNLTRVPKSSAKWYKEFLTGAKHDKGLLTA